MEKSDPVMATLDGGLGDVPEKEQVSMAKMYCSKKFISNGERLLMSREGIALLCHSDRDFKENWRVLLAGKKQDFEKCYQALYDHTRHQAPV